MSSILAQKIEAARVPSGSLAIFWLGQAGFVYKTPGGRVIYIDPYLSDCVHRLLSAERYGFKRIMPAPIAPEEIDAAEVVCTHSHADHFDYDAIPVLARSSGVHFTAAPDCPAEFARLGVPPHKYQQIEIGQTLDFGEYQLTGVFADHGDLAPQALGILLRVGNITVWQVADTAYRPDRWQDVFQSGVDVLIPPINGAYGNLNEVEAARLAGDCRAKWVIPCHFWMFAEHGGDPAKFLDACKIHAPAAVPVLMAQGESLMVTG